LVDLDETYSLENPELVKEKFGNKDRDLEQVQNDLERSKNMESSSLPRRENSQEVAVANKLPVQETEADTEKAQHIEDASSQNSKFIDAKILEDDEDSDACYEEVIESTHERVKKDI